MDFKQYIIEWINSNPGKAAGAIIGFFIALLVIVLGPVETMFIVVLVAIGILIGKIRDDNIPVIDQLRGIFKRNK